MLLNSFFEIGEQSASTEGDKTIIKALISINKTHKIFEGHFPDQPVVPGVCMIQMVKEVLENHMSKKLLLESAGNIKFLSVINPEIHNKLNVEISYSPVDHSFNVDASFSWEELIFFKIKGSYSVKVSSNPQGF